MYSVSFRADSDSGVVAFTLDLPCNVCKMAARESLPSQPIWSAAASRTASVTFGNVVPKILTTGRAHGFDAWRHRWSRLGWSDALWTKGTLLVVIHPSSATLKLAYCPRFPFPAIARLIVRLLVIFVGRAVVRDFLPFIPQIPRTLMHHDHLANQMKRCRCSVGKMFD